MFGKTCAVTAVVAVVAYLVAKQLRRRAKRRRLLATPFPEEWKQIVEKNVPLFRRLPEQLKDELGGLVPYFHQPLPAKLDLDDLKGILLNLHQSKLHQAD